MVKLPELSRQLMQKETPEEFAQLLHDAWLGYGVSDLEGASFTIDFESEESKEKVDFRTFLDAMKYLGFRAEKLGDGFVFTLGKSPFHVEARLEGDVLHVDVVEEAPQEQVKQFLSAYRKWLLSQRSG